MWVITLLRSQEQNEAWFLQEGSLEGTETREGRRTNRGKRTKRSKERICHKGFCGFILVEEESDSAFNFCF